MIKSMKDIIYFINTNEFMDVNLQRFQFTWSNKHLEDQIIQICLNRLILSNEGLILFWDYIIITLQNIQFNHSSLL